MPSDFLSAKPLRAPLRVTSDETLIPAYAYPPACAASSIAAYCLGVAIGISQNLSLESRTIAFIQVTGRAPTDKLIPVGPRNSQLRISTRQITASTGPDKASPGDVVVHFASRLHCRPGARN